MALVDGELVQFNSANLVLRNALANLIAKSQDILPLRVFSVLLRAIVQLTPKQRTRIRAAELMIETRKFNALG